MDPSASAVLLIFLGGGLNGSALLPMKFTGGWKFENTWVLYAVCAYLIGPWVVAALTVPELGSVYSAAGVSACVLTATFGFGWGISVVLYGVGVSTIGLSLASAILMGSSVAIGSLAPLLLKNPALLRTAAGHWIAFADLLMLSGVLLCAWAGERRGRAQQLSEGRQVTLTGILTCLTAGLLSTLFNFALAYGDIISKQAVHAGAASFNAANAIWSLAVSFGSLPSILWCSWKLHRDNSWYTYKDGPVGRNVALCLVMAALWIVGTVMYGAAAGKLGSLGPVLGWPVYMSGIILAASFWGWATGEWRKAPRSAVLIMAAGVVVQILSMALLSRQ